MPTISEYAELVDNCTWIWTSVDGINGYKVTGSNGNHIFLPAAGHRYTSWLDYAGEEGRYWSGSAYVDDDTEYASFLSFYDSSVSFSGGAARYFGASVRAVTK